MTVYSVCKDNAPLFITIYDAANDLAAEHADKMDVGWH